MIRLYTLHYNNYFNRNFKRENSLQEYLDQDYWTNGHEVNNVSFNPADGVDTTQIVSYNADNDDYCIVAKIENNVETILSRWFIMEAKRTRTNQYLLTLKRDVLVDNYDTIKEDPIFVEKGTLQENDPLICNDEGMKFNQIKNDEKLIISKDFGDGADVPYEACPWLLAFLTKDFDTDTITVATNEFPTDTYTLAQIASEVGITASQLRNYLKFPSGAEPIGKAYGNEVHFNIGYVRGGGSIGEGMKLVYSNSYGYRSFYDTSIYLNDFVFNVLPDSRSRLKENLDSVFGSISSTTIKNIVEEAFNESIINWNQIKILESYIGKKVNVNGIIYKIGSIRKIESGVWQDRPLENDNAVINSLTTAVLEGTIIRRESGVYHISTQTRNVYLELEETTQGNITLNLSVSGQTRNKTANCVCDVIAIPFSNIPFGKTHHDIYEGYGYAKLSKEELYRIATAFSEQLGENCKDVQIVPYINIPTQLGYFDEEFVYRPCIDLDGLVEGKDYLQIKQNDDMVSLAFCLPSANVQTYRNLYIPYNNPKIKSQTEFIRLVSPTGQSIYEMNPSKNGGLSILNITGTLKPYNTYYKITPNFGFIYGQNFDKDPRGLIIQDNFSMTQISDAWTQYQLQNKNYQEIFNRQLQSLDIQQGIARQEAPIKAISGAISGGASGAVTGFMGTGSPYGAIAGAAVGLTAGTVGGALDLANMDKRLKDQRDLTIQNFAYTLGNVQARPDTITKTDTFNIDSKLMPYVEFYTCSDVERKALEDKIAYDGMTVMRIGTLEEFQTNGGFFKGQYIKNLNNSFNGDNHMLESINTELMKGVYL